MKRRFADDSWYVVQNGVRYGPISAHDIYDSLRVGAFSSSAIVWQQGFEGWEPIQVHFPSKQNNREASENTTSDALPDVSIGIIASLLPDAADRSVQPRPPQNPIPRWRRYASAIGFALFAAFFLINQRKFVDLTPPWISAAAWIASIASTVLFGGLLIREWWVYARYKALTSELHYRWGILSALCVFFAVGLVTVAITFGANTQLIYRISIERKSFSNFSVSVVPDSSEIRIVGFVGPHLSNRLSQMLATYPNIRTLSIKSPGGLVDEALGIAEQTEKYKRIGTIAREQCSSACLTIFMAGATRYADWDMQFGFHAVSPITSIRSKILLSVVEDHGKTSDEYLIRRGIPRKFVEAGNKFSGDNAEYISAIKMHEVGAVTGLLDGNTVISLNEAKWREIIRQMSSTKSPITKVFHAISLSSPELADQFAASIYAALQGGDLNTIENEVQSMVKKISQPAISSASDESVFQYLVASSAILHEFFKHENWKECATYLGDNSISPSKRNILKTLGHDLLNGELEALAGMILSASSNGWELQPVPESVEKYGEQVLSKIRQMMTRRKIDLESIRSSPRGQCIFANALMKETIVAGSTNGARLFRWLNSLK